MTNLTVYDESQSLFNSVSDAINEAKVKVYKAVNSELVALYWKIGRLIKTEIVKDNRAAYGKQIVGELSKRLTIQYGRGYSQRNLFNMINLYEAFADFQILQTLSAKLSLSNLIEIVKITDPVKREFYLTMCANENWSFRTLRERISSMLYERTIISKKPEDTIVNDLALLKSESRMSPELFFRDPYVLDFLGLKDTYSEKDLEAAILVELEKFILEMGKNSSII